jgi:hypothetical protein
MLAGREAKLKQIYVDILKASGQVEVDFSVEMLRQQVLEIRE